MKVIVQRLEEGNRTEYAFKTLKEALQFIADSEAGNKKTEDGYKIDGEYEIYMPRSYK